MKVKGSEDVCEKCGEPLSKHGCIVTCGKKMFLCANKEYTGVIKVNEKVFDIREEKDNLDEHTM